MRSRLIQAIAAVLLVSIVINSFFVVFPAKAGEPERMLQDGLHLMAVSQTILAGETEEEIEYAKAFGLMSLRSAPLSASVDEQLVVAMINAVKGEIANLIKECDTTRRALLERDDECAVSTLDNICEEGKRELRATLSLLRQIRGDKRKFFTRVGANIKEAGKRLWHAVGPIGRRILRTLGEEVVQAVKTPGGIEFKALRVLVRSRLKSLARKEIRSAIQRGAERLIMKKWEVARGPTGDQCIEGDEVTESQEIPKYGADWFDEVWQDMETLLALERKNCQKTAIVELRRCLLDNAASGTTAEDAIKACEPIFNGIPMNDAGGSVALTGQTYFLDATPNEVTITYPSAGGEVVGQVNFQRYDDVFGCTYTLTTTEFVGQYDQATCTMRGEVTSELLFEGYCVSVCGTGPASPTSCPVTMNRTTVWEATLEDSALIGDVGDLDCDRGCFSFRSPGFGVNP
ncbi:MAG: hypothetical protein KAI06_10230 [Anaerolineales bacterium]|nr:hypothetical protein [Anaerolineales bacterium]